MPALELKTNVKLADPKAFIQEFSLFSANLLKKPHAYISVSYTYNEFLAWEGTFEPAFLLNITSLDNLNAESNEGFSKDLFDFFEKHLGVKDNRGYITFFDPGRENIGHAHTTFGTIFGRK
ncbi:hypothetical protein PHLCEN_2v13601 [Hermanssonia centrifuga]|uniref:L-dopachrome isomerase n=1 Tax=Hermanssonia centrifuga TaxID=98765 RepID=A0A2R6NEV5_9APHY|nr:hypothetical protein PHLCEN_2v13601 [Hermanssonia centrifuga]